ncbi:hypothetical protein M1740_21010 [Salmonella enterica subsp. enterica serovar Montevideo]|uniref:hypothetical protein n=1 Tax=Salmonella enterica TaxID=28901 RepID=UPI001282CAB3|nr:hypothetical protein [Salmonella enterica]EBM9948234.1 hypothetical protein [Salmonella enterica subsp. enterica serovar Give]EED3922182.1 hypothetical protein [Salmonella enterica subsp. enterica serovar Give]EED4547993.1 hypothetical protein [Salmonella enterica subsp. enterica serovar Give]MCT7116959.1 hypothetical protein [Salmonella enterica subsp. enterica serovar Montevideo]
MMVDISSLLLRDFSDLTRPELIARLRRLKILQARVEYTHDNFSPRQLRAFILGTLMLFMGYVLTDSILFSGVAGLITIIGVLHYSRLPMTWHAQLKDGISRFESLRSSPLRQMDEADAHYDWHYASYCLAAEIQLIYSALSQPARPFSA